MTIPRSLIKISILFTHVDVDHWSCDLGTVRCSYFYEAHYALPQIMLENMQLECAVKVDDQI